MADNAPTTPALSGAPADWRNLVNTYQQSKAAWERLKDEHEQKFVEFKRLTPKKPVPPKLARPVTEEMTITEIKAIPLDRDPEVYEAELAEWERRCEPLRREMLKPSQAAMDAAWDSFSGALKAIEAYQSPTLVMLCEKIDIMTAEYALDDDSEAMTIIADVRRLATQGGF